MSTIRTRPRPVAGQIRRPALRLGQRYRSDLLDGLKLHWDMYELSGARVDSVSGVSLTDNGTVLSTTGLHPNKNATVHDEALAEYLTRPSIPAVEFGDVDLTVAIWCKFEAAAYSAAPFANDQNLVTKGTVGGADAEYAIFVLGGTPGTLRFECRGTSTLTSATITTSDLTAGEWALIVGRHDSVGNLLDLYFRPVGATAEAATPAAHSDGITNKNGAFRLAADGDMGPTGLFAGNIDSVSIWQKRLTDAQLDRLFRKQLFTASNGLPFPF